jgi:uncharacterized protein (DUF1697 family)
MIRYLAFLRGINVGGHNKIKMKDLEGWFLSWKFMNVKTYIQSGNVAFDSEIMNPGDLKFSVEKRLKEISGYDVTVILRTLDEIKKMADQNPFIGFQGEPADKHYICLTDSRLNDPHLKLPFVNEKEGLYLIGLQNGNAFVVSRQMGGSYGFPNNWIERAFKVASTARNWNTIQRIIESQG